jgi:hypothetical protein
MWGAATHDRSTGIHRPLSATAIAIAAPLDGDNTSKAEPALILVAIDHCLLWRREMEDLLAAVSTKAEIPINLLHFCFSHTHGAGLMGLERAGLPGGELIAPYLATLAEKSAAIAREAVARMQTATILYGVGRCSLAAHRDFRDEATEQYVCGFNPEGPTDDTVLVARVTDDSQRILATIVNYACHPTTLAWKNTLISPDYPGAMRETIEQAMGAPCVFLQGASGDIGPREGYVGDPAIADRNGRELGYAALSALESLPPAGCSFAYQAPVVSGATLGTWEYVPFGEVRQRQVRVWKHRRWDILLPLRPDLPDLGEVKSQLAEWESREAAARTGGRDAEVRDCRAQAERLTRLLVKLDGVSADGSMRLPITLCRLGDAFWLFVEAEYYNVFQRELRRIAAPAPLVVATLTNGWRPSYLPPAELYGRGIYQEQVAVLAPGCLERMIEEVGCQIQEWSR